MTLVALGVVVATAIGVLAHARAPERAERVRGFGLNALLYVLVPFLAFVNLNRLEVTTDVGVGVLLAYVALALGGGLAYLVGAKLLRAERPTTGAMMALTVQANTGYLGLPLTAAVLGGGAALQQAFVYDSFVQAPALLVGGFAIGAAFGTTVGEGWRERLVAFAKNPPLIAVALALLLPRDLAPEALVDLSHELVYVLLPFGFFAVGVTLASERVAFPPTLTREVVAVLVLRLVVAPLLLLALAAPLIELPDAYLLEAAMACGVNVLVVAHATGLDLKLTANAIAWSTVVVLVAALVGVAVA